ncbi:MAG: zf-HC2 domain-containing protein [Treponemataceae bacterium]|nr:zf-HC2 domain-containing protein [Treponemataceae bacterium]
MSTCPERELLCVYVDGELPEKYRVSLEKHIENCESCKRHLTQLQAIQTALQNDAGAMHFSDKALDESFTRLQTKQNYRRVALAPSPRRTAGWYGLGAVAAAAILAVILPLQLRHNAALPVIPMADAVHQTKMLHEKGVAADNSATLAAFASYNRNTSEKSAVTVNLVKESLETLATIDIFRPELTDKAITITINLETVPGILPDDAQYWQQAGGTLVSFSAADNQ